MSATLAAPALAASRERRVGLACAFGVMGVWATFLVTSRLAARADFTPWDVAALRYAGSFLGALPLVAVHGWPRVAPLRAAALLATAGFGFPLFAFAGFALAPASHAAVMLPGALPFVTAALWWAAFGEVWTARRKLSLGIVAIGMALLAADTFASHPGAWRGDLLFLAGCSSWAAYMLLVRRWGIGALDATLVVALGAAPVFLPLWWGLLPSTLATAPVAAMAAHAAFQGLVAVLVAGFLFTRAMLALGATATATITAVVPALAALLAWPLLGEALGPAGLAGVAVVTAGMAYGVARAARQPA